MAGAVFKLSYLKRTFFFTHLLGALAAVLFPVIARPLVGEAAFSLAFFSICAVMGYAVGAIMFLFVLITLKKQLRRQVEILTPLVGAMELKSGTVEELQGGMELSVSAFLGRVHQLLQTIDQFVPHYRSLAESSRYVGDRAREGLNAAKATRVDATAMAGKQQEVLAQVESLSDRTQDEATLSRELSASLEEMAGAMDHSTSKFLETSTAVDEMAFSTREVTSQADGIAQSVEGTARDLESIGTSLERIRQGVFAGAEATGAVRQDAEAGLKVVRISIEEMARIEQESSRAMQAMQRLSRQTGEVVKIIEVIKELVSDTELLAFNAAIIAAKAGEEGKGFSVVAEEIRDLADRTTASAQEIHRIVRAIGGDTLEVTAAVEATSQRIAKGKQLSQSTGEALRKIVDSASQTARSSEEIASLTGAEEIRARSLLEDAGRSLRSVKAIARAMREQQTAIGRIQEGVNEMKGAADQIARGMDEQVRANREFDKGLAEREEQVRAINDATRFQMATIQRVFKHFEGSEDRLNRNVDKAKIIAQEGTELEVLAERMRQLVMAMRDPGESQPESGAPSAAPPKAAYQAAR
ncbi:MAG: hypothetical protein IH614_10960 [Desulfuromonadales bacterium]|nr:hypothetical protein [Desulfuromonadales bacterium]